MKSILRKLRSSTGESLVETLCAILIMVLSCLIVAAMSRTAVDMNRRANVATAALYEELNVAEAHAGSADATLRINNSMDAAVKVTGESGKLRSYTIVKKGS